MDAYIHEKISNDIDKCVNIYGLEAMWEKIYTVYAGTPSVRDQYLQVFYEKYPFLKKN